MTALLFNDTKIEYLSLTAPCTDYSMTSLLSYVMSSSLVYYAVKKSSSLKPKHNSISILSSRDEFQIAS